MVRIYTFVAMVAGTYTLLKLREDIVRQAVERQTEKVRCSLFVTLTACWPTLCKCVLISFLWGMRPRFVMPES